ncbi:MAG: hypothetical protein H7A51_03985 [Akkermansiaceae bacterium]|nr:hypothetical protein [Akkermansiaceae bacterium]
MRFKRGDAARLDVTFLTNGTTATEIGDPSILEMRFGAKPRGRYDVSYLVHSSVWTLPEVGAENPFYQSSPSFNTVELDSAMQVGSAAGSELSEITLMGEITWREGEAEPTSTRTFLVVVENDVNRGTEGVPTDSEPSYPLPGAIELIAHKGVADGYPSLDSEARIPVAQLPLSAELTIRKGVADGYAELDGQGLIPTLRLPFGDGIQLTNHGVAIGQLANGYGTAAIVGALASGAGVSIGYGAASHGKAVAVGEYAAAWPHGVAIGYGARTEGTHCIAIGSDAVTGDPLHGTGRLEIAPNGSSGPRLSAHVWAGYNVFQFSVTDLHGGAPTASQGGAVFNHTPGTLPPGMMMFGYSSGVLSVFLNDYGTLRTATLPLS